MGGIGLQSRFGGNWGEITWSLGGLPPKRDWSSKGVNPYKHYVWHYNRKG